MIDKSTLQLAAAAFAAADFAGTPCKSMKTRGSKPYVEVKEAYEIDMCSGPILKKMLRFAVPLMASGVLQLLFNAADVIVVGRFSGDSPWPRWGPTRR